MTNISELIQQAVHIQPAEAQINALLEIISALNDRVLFLNERVNREMVKSDLPTPMQAIQPLIDQVLQPVRHVEPPIAAQDEAQERLKQLKLDRATYRQLLETTERLIAIYELQCHIPF